MRNKKKRIEDKKLKEQEKKHFVLEVQDSSISNKVKIGEK